MNIFHYNYVETGLKHLAKVHKCYEGLVTIELRTATKSQHAKMPAKQLLHLHTAMYINIRRADNALSTQYEEYASTEYKI